TLAQFIANYDYCTRRQNGLALEEEDEEVNDDLVEDANVEGNGTAPANQNENGHLELQPPHRGVLLRERQFPRIIRYRRYNEHQDPANFYREQLMLFYPWRDEVNE